MAEWARKPGESPLGLVNWLGKAEAHARRMHHSKENP